MYLRHPDDFTKFSITNTQSVSALSYAETFKDRFVKISSIALSRQAKEQKTQRHKRNMSHTESKIYEPAQLVYLLAPNCTHLPHTATKSKQLRFTFVGPLIIREWLSNHQFLLQTLQGDILLNTFHISRLKSTFVRNNGNISQTMEELRKNSDLDNASLAATDQYGRKLEIMEEHT